MKDINYRTGKTCIIFFAIFISSVIPSIADNPELTPVPSPLQTGDVARLSGNLSLVEKRINLPKLLEILSDKFNVEFRISPDANSQILKTKILTISVTNIEINKLMTAIANTYSSEWLFDNTHHSYQLTIQNSNDGNYDYSRIGTQFYYNYNDRVGPGFYEKINKRNTLLQRLKREVRDRRLISKGGIPFTALPIDTAEAIKKEYQTQFALSYLNTYFENLSILNNLKFVRISSSTMGTETSATTENEQDRDLAYSIELLDSDRKNLDLNNPYKWRLPVPNKTNSGSMEPKM